MRPVRFDRLVLAIAVVLLVAACGGAEADEPTTTAAPATAAPATTAASATTAAPTTTTAAPTTTPAPTTTAAPTTTLPPIADLPPVEDVVGGTRSGDGWLVEPGLYTSTRADIPIRLDIAEPVAFFDGGDVTLTRPGVTYSQFDLYFFFTPAGITPADVAGIHPDHGRTVPDNTEASPEDLGAWFDAVPQITVVRSDDGAGWRRWDVTVDATAGDTYGCSFGNCVATLVSNAYGPIVVGDTDTFRIWQFTGDGSGLFGFMQSDPATWDDTAALADMLVTGLSFGD